MDSKIITQTEETPKELIESPYDKGSSPISQEAQAIVNNAEPYNQSTILDRVLDFKG